MFDLQGKVAVVTGGSGVLGGAMCSALASAGAKVVVLATTQSKIDAVVEKINAAGGEAMGAAANVLDRPEMEAAAERVLVAWGRIDVLVNAAGGNKPEATTTASGVTSPRTLFDIPQDALEWVFNLNLMGTLIASQAFAKAMIAQGSGSVINISSMAALRPLTRVLAYSAAKSAVNNFTQWLAVHMAHEYSREIRVNAIAPGFFVGEQNYYLLFNRETGNLTERGQKIIDHTPLGRFGDPQDLAGTLLWLASDASRFVTGIIVPVDGGFSAYSGV
jgi:NAD(P)-dependent dehydrogenase (short-subunit alcohol dehydrogenase family)